ncbi:hypothetical protein ESCO_004348 [Escovopsis weberi]|uniref:Uncharacterized protein n=1 Tax=Escovopsis weberi TaxID=150374 RepID=A0A0M9VVK1_ESCWE|nr:hypothetical protein ESCO_004348 [Escovopsis weberi]
MCKYEKKIHACGHNGMGRRVLMCNTECTAKEVHPERSRRVCYNCTKCKKLDRRLAELKERLIACRETLEGSRDEDKECQCGGRCCRTMGP